MASLLRSLYSALTSPEPTPVHPPTKIITVAGRFCADPATHRFGNAPELQSLLGGMRYARCKWCDAKVVNPKPFVGE